MGWIKSLKIEIAKPESDLFKVNAYIQFYLPFTYNIYTETVMHKAKFAKNKKAESIATLLFSKKKLLV